MRNEVIEYVKNHFLPIFPDDGLVVNFGAGTLDQQGGLPQMFRHYLAQDLVPGQGIDLSFDFCKTEDWPTLTYQGALCLETLEHVERPDDAVKHIQHRLQLGGLLCLTVPTVWPEHKHPKDCWRFLEDGVRYLLRDAQILHLAKEPERGAHGIFAISRKV